MWKTLNTSVRETIKWQPTGQRPGGRPRKRWIVRVKMDLWTLEVPEISSLKSENWRTSIAKAKEDEDEEEECFIIMLCVRILRRL